MLKPRWPLLLILALSVPAGAAPMPDEITLLAGPKYHLVNTHSLGDTTRYDMSTALSFKLTPKVGKLSLPAKEFWHGKQQSYLETITEVDLDDRPQKLRRTYYHDRTIDHAPGNSQEDDSSLTDKAIDVSLHDGELGAKSLQGPVAPEVLLRLGAAFDDRLPYCPDHPVAPGDEWTVVATGTPAGVTATITVKFMEVLPIPYPLPNCFGLAPPAGHPIARLKVALTMQRKVAGLPAAIEMKLEGTLDHALDVNRPVHIVLEGPFRVRDLAEAGYKGLSLTGSGKAHVSIDADVYALRGEAFVPVRKERPGMEAEMG